MFDLIYEQKEKELFDVEKRKDGCITASVGFVVCAEITIGTPE